MNLLQEYKDYIREHHSHWYTIKETTEGFTLETEYAKAYVNFYEFEITTCELKIENCKEDNIFYLHFELKDEDHAKQLFEEMIDSLHDVKDTRTLEVMLCCSSGLTTSFFAEKLNEAAEVLSLDMHFMAESYTLLYDVGSEKDVILLAPQIGYLYEEVKKILNDKIVIQIPAAAFGSYDTSAVIDLVREELSKERKIEEGPYTPRSGEYGEYMVILALTSRKSFRRNTTLAYRVYNECQIVEENQIIKDRWSIEDYKDLLDVVLPKYPNIQNVYIATPGIIDNNKLTFNYMNIEEFDIVEEFEKRYKKNFVLSNRHDAVARGYYEDHKEDKNMVVYYCGLFNHGGGAGIILDGKMLHGKYHLAGEVHYMLKSLYFTEYYPDLVKTKEGQAELTAKQILPLIVSLSPEVVCIANPLVTDVKEVTKYIDKYIPCSLQPEFRIVEEPVEDMYWGSILLGMEELRNREKK